MVTQQLCIDKREAQFLTEEVQNGYIYWLDLTHEDRVLVERETPKSITFKEWHYAQPVNYSLRQSGHPYCHFLIPSVDNVVGDGQTGLGEFPNTAVGVFIIYYANLVEVGEYLRKAFNRPVEFS